MKTRTFCLLYFSVSVQTIFASISSDSDCKYPENAVKVNRTEQKAWNKCIDLIDTVYSCEDTKSGKAPVKKCLHSIESDFTELKPVKPNEFPHIVTLVYDDDTLPKTCGGSLISEQWILTSAHCIYSKSEKAEVKHIIFFDDSEIKNKHRIIAIHRHPNYKGSRIYDDIALLKLEKPVTFSEKIRPACLHVGDDIESSKLISIYWSRDINDSVLYKEMINKYSHEECVEYYNQKTRRSPDGVRESTQICAGTGKKIEECPVNSGFPLQINNENVTCTYTIVATGAIGKPCSYGHPDIYTKISPYISWIESLVWP